MVGFNVAFSRKSSWEYFDVPGRREALIALKCKAATNVKDCVNLHGATDF